MAKKKRHKKRTVYGVIEGQKDELNFLNFLKEVYLDENATAFKIAPIHGGNPDRLIAMAIKNLHCGHDRLFVWIDEDTEVSLETMESLYKCWRLENKNEFSSCRLKDLQHVYNPGKKNPILIVSQPICVEALILRTLGRTVNHQEYDPKKRKEQIKALKNTLSGVIGKKNPIDFYRENLNKMLLEERRKQIVELDLLISILKD